MRTLLLLSLLAVGAQALSAQAPAQTPPPKTTPPKTAAPAPAPAQPQKPPPAQPRQARPRAQQPAGRSGMAMTVTDAQGGTLGGIRVEVMGPSDRSGETDGSGQLNFPGLQAGTYRLRFSGDAVTAFEREIVVRAGQIASFDVMLNPAPPPKVVTAPAASAAAAAPPPAPAVGPSGQPQTLSLYDMAEKELGSRQPRREILVACSGSSRTTLVLLTTENQPQRLYENAEVSYYVLGGQATVRVANADTQLNAGGYVAVPRGVPFSIARRGRQPLSLLAILNGEPCEQAK
jgi:mannose-6-phosphate isomerase-like protein (cupin superfamily)